MIMMQNSSYVIRYEFAELRHPLYAHPPTRCILLPTWYYAIGKNTKGVRVKKGAVNCKCGIDEFVDSNSCLFLWLIGRGYTVQYKIAQAKGGCERIYFSQLCWNFLTISGG